MLLDIGAGLRPYPNAIHVDAYKYAIGDMILLDVTKHRLPNRLFTYIHCVHLLEYLTYKEVEDLLKELYLRMDTNAILRIVVPDLEYYAQSKSLNDKSHYYHSLIEATSGQQRNAYDIIKSTYTASSLEAIFKKTVDRLKFIPRTDPLYNIHASVGDLQYILKKTLY